MIWYVFDEKGTPDIVIQGAYSYPVLNVIKEGSFLLNEDANDGEEEITGNESIIDNRNTLISDRMISLFFNEIVGTDRNWSEPDEYFSDDYND